MQVNTPQDDQKKKPARKWKWLRRLLVFFLVLVMGCIWFDGPGIRWLLPKAVSYFAAKHGVSTEMIVSGRVSSNLAFHNIRASGGPLDHMSLAELRPHYSIKRAIQGDFDGIELRGLSLRYDLDKKFPGIADDPEPKEPFDLHKSLQTLRKQQQLLRQYHVHLDSGSIELHKSANTLAKLDALEFHHEKNQEVWTLQTSGLQWQKQSTLPQQKSTITWTPDGIEIDELRAADDIALQKLYLTTPADAKISLSARAVLASSIWDLNVAPGVENVTLSLSDGDFSTTDAARIFVKEIPSEATLEKFSLHIVPHGFSLEKPQDLEKLLVDIDVNVGLRDLRHDKYQAEKISLIVKKDAADVSAKITSSAYGGSVNLDAIGHWDKDSINPDDLKNLSLDYHLTIPELREILQQTYPLWAPPEKPMAAIPPSAALAIKGKVRLDDGFPQAINAAIDLDHQEASHPDLAITADTSDNNAWQFSLKTTGLESKGTYKIKERAYDAQAQLTSFDPHVFTPVTVWLDVALPQGMKSDIRWTGQGSLTEKSHNGSCLIESFKWHREQGDIDAEAVASYQWPQSASISDMRVKMNNQEVRFDARYQPGSLAVSRLSHREGDRTMIQGKADIPLPEKISGINDLLSQEKPWSISLKSEVLPLSLANQWLPAGSPLPVTGNARIDIDVKGTPASPRITSLLELNDVRHTERKDLAAANLTMRLLGEKEKLSLDARLVTTRTAPVTVTASMPFRPHQWQKSPDAISKENIQAAVVIPALELSRFADLAPQIKDLAGQLRGNIDVRGPLSKPQINGNLALDKFTATLPNKKVPPIRDGSARISFVEKQVRLDNLQITLAGGVLRGNGMADLTNSSTPRLDFRIRGDALPLWRDDAVISRANADLSLSGNLQNARIAGRVDIVDSLIYKDFEILPIGKPFTLSSPAALPALDAKADRAAAGLPAPYANWTLDVAVKTADPFLIRGNLAEGEILVDCRVGGTLGDPKPNGHAEIRDLSAALPLSKLTVESGFVRLTPATGMDPQLDIRGFSRVSNYDVNLYVYGAVSAPKMLLTSEPPLPENEIMTLLATGTTTKGLGDGSMAQTRAMQLILEEFRRGRLPMGKRLAPLLGKLDKVELAVGEPDPYSGKKRASAKMPVHGNWFVSGAVDGEGKTRSLLLFQLKFR